MSRWPTDGMPRNPPAWLAGTARHKALDIVRGDRRRADKELLAALAEPEPVWSPDLAGDDRLGLILLCCHPALAIESRLALTLRSVGGVPTEEIAALFLVPRSTVAQRLVRAKRKISAAKISFHTPDIADTRERIPDVLEVIRLIFTHGYRHPGASEGACLEAIRLARLVYDLLPNDAEVAGLLSLLLLTDARRPARSTVDGVAITLGEQDRELWSTEEIAEGRALLAAAAALDEPGPYQIEAAIAALHLDRGDGDDHTDWTEIVRLYGQLLHYKPSPVVEANRAVAVAMADGPAAGLAILDDLVAEGRLDEWPQLHVARGSLLSQLDRADEAIDAFRTALDLDLPAAEAAYITQRLDELVPTRSSDARADVEPDESAGLGHGRAEGAGEAVNHE